MSDDDGKRYKIVRFFAPGPGYRRPYTRRGLKGLTLAQAQAHCQDPKTHRAGKWFDGYTEDK